MDDLMPNGPVAVAGKQVMNAVADYKKNNGG